MQSLTGNALLGMIRRIGLSIKRLIVSFIQWLPKANWLQILVICVPLALLVTILPLVLMLFALLFIIKLLITDTDVVPSTTASTEPATTSSTLAAVMPSTTGTELKSTNPYVGDE